MARPRSSFRIAYSLLAALACAGGCSSETREGRVEIAWNVGPGVVLNSASYDVVAPDGTVTSGTVAVGNNSQVHVSVGPMPIANGYTLIVSGVASDGQTGCSGMTMFNISSTASTIVTVGLECSKEAPGQVLVVGAVNVCPSIDGVSASPAEVSVGSTIALGVTGHDPDGNPSP